MNTFFIITILVIILIATYIAHKKYFGDKKYHYYEVNKKIKRICIDNINDDILIESGDTLSVTTNKDITITENDDTLYIRANNNSGFTNTTITLPSDETLSYMQVFIDNGNVFVNNANINELYIGVDNGNVVMKNSNISNSTCISCDKGNIDIEGYYNNATLDTMHGFINVKGALGDASFINAVSGTILLLLTDSVDNYSMKLLANENNIYFLKEEKMHKKEYIKGDKQIEANTIDGKIFVREDKKKKY